ncbi:hypothetical protein J3R30DRAFT_3305915 [Lentinula aciculospora]|uniref:Matrin-type domain-containing protein n=1 Tax=Lentinula aciculospora TaxID=153920 RepID=A0A9W8ZVS3_9AGAR|nr:hypothetical protein J3R30DRAFT_3305915 [Lentinula aciculospora]
MSEYWVSKKKYFCKYCEIYIADDVPSRQHHENGLRHQGNRERFIRGIYKDGEKRKKDAEEEKREMARVELAAQAAYSADIGAGRAKASSSSSSGGASASTSKKITQKAPTKPSKPSNSFVNYSTAASLGYTDPDVERATAEAALHQSQGVAGEWQVVESKMTSAPAAIERGNVVSTSTFDDGSHFVKRPADEQPDDARNFKLRRKLVGTGLREIYDPGVIKLKPKKKEVVKGEAEEVKTKNESSTLVEEKPKWSVVQWKRATPEVSSSANDGAAPSPPSENTVSLAVSQEGGHGCDALFNHQDELSKMKTETVEIPIPEPDSEVKSSLIEPVSSMFRKRKFAAGNGSRIKREV